MSWLGAPEAAEAGLLCFAREPRFVFAANLGAIPVPVPPHREILLASGPVPDGTLGVQVALSLTVAGPVT